MASFGDLAKGAEPVIKMIPDAAGKVADEVTATISHGEAQFKSTGKVATTLPPEWARYEPKLKKTADFHFTSAVVSFTRIKTAASLTKLLGNTTSLAAQEVKGEEPAKDAAEKKARLLKIYEQKLRQDLKRSKALTAAGKEASKGIKQDIKKQKIKQATDKIINDRVREQVDKLKDADITVIGQEILNHARLEIKASGIVASVCPIAFAYSVSEVDMRDYDDRTNALIVTVNNEYEAARDKLYGTYRREQTGKIKTEDKIEKFNSGIALARNVINEARRGKENYQPIQVPDELAHMDELFQREGPLWRTRCQKVAKVKKVAAEGRVEVNGKKIITDFTAVDAPEFGGIPQHVTYKNVDSKVDVDVKAYSGDEPKIVVEIKQMDTTYLGSKIKLTDEQGGTVTFKADGSRVGTGHVGNYIVNHMANA